VNTDFQELYNNRIIYSYNVYENKNLLLYMLCSVYRLLAAVSWTCRGENRAICI